jgi:hypothetical protein
MLEVLFNSKGFIHCEFILEKCFDNKTMYKDIEGFLSSGI